MILIKWNDLPSQLKNDNVKKYYDLLYRKKSSLILKKIFDILGSIALILIFLPIMIIISIIILIDSKGPILFVQNRVTRYGKIFKILKFRTMKNSKSVNEPLVTVENDKRITKVGIFLRKYRLDELPQLFNIIKGDMTFVGARPEVLFYVEKYSEEMFATLLLPAGLTSEASISFKEENCMLDSSKDYNCQYINEILPKKMYYNLKELKEFSFINDIRIIFKTIFKVFGYTKK